MTSTANFRRYFSQAFFQSAQFEVLLAKHDLPVQRVESTDCLEKKTNNFDYLIVSLGWVVGKRLKMAWCRAIQIVLTAMVHAMPRHTKIVRFARHINRREIDIWFSCFLMNTILTFTRDERQRCLREIMLIRKKNNQQWILLFRRLDGN